MADFEVDQKIPENIENIGVTVFLNAKRKQKTLGGRFGEIPNRLSELPVEEHMIPRKYLLGERHLYGGCTCLAFVRNTKTNMCRVSTAGDSRLMILPGKNMVVTEDDPALIFCARDGRHMSRTMSMKTLGRARSSADVGTASKAMITREHSIDTPAERARLKRDFAGKYIIGSKNNEGLMGYFYPNVTLPYTGGLIPTRGFGNRLYFGSGWTHEPQVSKVITLTPGSLILGSSDGVFDPVLWGKDVKDLVNFVNDIKQIPHAKLGGIAERIYNETSRRCIESDQFRIDDISIFITKIPETKESLDL
uniref:PPM-type phosphatase domain-containing protein n=1 Tax=Aplanochytrium stocchinoi TaxID=215587 RepID=A0A7S3PKC3_9STRA